MKSLSRDKGNSKICFALTFLAIFMAFPLYAKEAVIYSSLKEADCRQPDPSVLALFEQRGVTAQQCPGVAGVLVFAVSSDANSWVEFGFGRSIWSSENSIVYQEPVRSFPNLSGGKMEWHIAPNGQPEAVIFRISSQNQRTLKNSVSELVAFRFGKDAIYYCGAETTNLKARALLAKKEACVGSIKSSPLP